MSVRKTVLIQPIAEEFRLVSAQVAVKRRNRIWNVVVVKGRN